MKVACRPQFWRLAQLDFWIRKGRYPNSTWAAQLLEVGRRTETLASAAWPSELPPSFQGTD
jgi:hypothetical protein